MNLVVVSAFGDYAVGDKIVDPGMVKEYMDSPHVVRVAEEPDAKDNPAP